MALWGSLPLSFCVGILLWYVSSRIRFVVCQVPTLQIDATQQSARQIPDNLFGIFFEELNHAGAGGLWAELVNNRGFEAGGPNTPSNFGPWTIIGNESSISVYTECSSPFPLNKVALRMEVYCGAAGSTQCPSGGVGVYNPGYWGMNIVRRKKYKVVLYIRSLDSVDLSVALTSSDGTQNLASYNIKAGANEFSEWTKVEFILNARASNVNSRLQLTTTKMGTITLDQVSVMPVDTYKGHGCRKELVSMLASLKPRFLRFPGGSYIQGYWTRNAFRWKATVGPWQERPGHFNDVWQYWTEDGLGLFEFLQLAEDIGASPVWVFYNGVSLYQQVPFATMASFVQDIMDGLQFAKGDANSTWGSVRAAMGHPEPFKLDYISVGNQECWVTNYRENYMLFYNAIKAAYPDINIVTNCDGSGGPLNHPADLYDVHVYTSSSDMFSKVNMFDNTPRNGPKAFVSEYAVTGKDAGKGTLIAALAEAAFLIGLERNSDVVEMASCAPLFVNDNDRSFNPDAIVFNSWQQYGCPNYWMQHFFKDSSGSILHPVTVQGTSIAAASAISWHSPELRNTYLKIKVVNSGNAPLKVNIEIAGLDGAISSFGSKKTVLTSGSPLDENSFQQPDKVVPVTSPLSNAGSEMSVVLDANSLTAFDLLLHAKHHPSMFNILMQNAKWEKR